MIILLRERYLEVNAISHIYLKNTLIPGDLMSFLTSIVFCMPLMHIIHPGTQAYIKNKINILNKIRKAAYKIYFSYFP